MLDGVVVPGVVAPGALDAGEEGAGVCASTETMSAAVSSAAPPALAMLIFTWTLPFTLLKIPSPSCRHHAAIAINSRALLRTASHARVLTELNNFVRVLAQ